MIEDGFDHDLRDRRIVIAIVDRGHPGPRRSSQVMHGPPTEIVVAGLSFLANSSILALGPDRVCHDVLMVKGAPDCDTQRGLQHTANTRVDRIPPILDKRAWTD